MNKLLKALFSLLLNESQITVCVIIGYLHVYKLHRAFFSYHLKFIKLDVFKFKFNFKITGTSFATWALACSSLQANKMPNWL